MHAHASVYLNMFTGKHCVWNPWSWTVGRVPFLNKLCHFLYLAPAALWADLFLLNCTTTFLGQWIEAFELQKYFCNNQVPEWASCRPGTREANKDAMNYLWPPACWALLSHASTAAKALFVVKSYLTYAMGTSGRRSSLPLAATHRAVTRHAPRSNCQKQTMLHWSLLDRSIPTIPRLMCCITPMDKAKSIWLYP